MNYNLMSDTLLQVSIFLKDKVQSSNGRFVLAVNGQVPWDTEVPGVVRLGTIYFMSIPALYSDVYGTVLLGT